MIIRAGEIPVGLPMDPITINH